jgi:hypothetical protein
LVSRILHKFIFTNSSPAKFLRFAFPAYTDLSPPLSVERMSTSSSDLRSIAELARLAGAGPPSARLDSRAEAGPPLARAGTPSMQPEKRKRGLGPHEADSGPQKANSPGVRTGSPPARAGTPAKGGPSSARAGSSARVGPSSARAGSPVVPAPSRSGTSSPAAPRTYSSDSQQSAAQRPPMSKIIRPLPSIHPDAANIARIQKLKADIHSKIQGLLPCISEWKLEEENAKYLFDIADVEFKDYLKKELDLTIQDRANFLMKLDKLQGLEKRLEQVLHLGIPPEKFREMMAGITRDLKAY